MLTIAKFCFVRVLLANALITARSELRKVLFWRRQSVVFLVVYEISRGPLIGFAPNSHGKRVLLPRSESLKVKIIGQRSKSPGTKIVFSALSVACVQFIFGKKKHFSL